MGVIGTILAFLAVLVVLVLVHELGHFIAAKRAGITVQEFGVGFPPRITSVVWRGTRYSLNWIPLGGFVRMLGEDGDVEAAKMRSSGFSEAEAGCEAARDRATPHPPCGLRPGPREAARPALPSVSPREDRVARSLQGALGALVALLGALLFLLQQARAGRALQHALGFAVQAPQQFDQVVRLHPQGDVR